ncbi:pyruvate formate lyase-activating protein, partial [Salmonella enterica]|nr:pyruvate formate lyase-activating protein [Salmonella enterica]
MSVLGRIHSFESCGTVDGPGIRFIVFFQGCLMRCLYCHNRDTWDTHGGQIVTVDELM